MPSAVRRDGPAISLQKIAPVEWWKICVEVRGQCVRQMPLEFPKGACASGLVRERHVERLAVQHPRDGQSPLTMGFTTGCCGQVVESMMSSMWVLQARLSFVNLDLEEVVLCNARDLIRPFVHRYARDHAMLRPSVTRGEAALVLIAALHSTDRHRSTSSPSSLVDSRFRPLIIAAERRATSHSTDTAGDRSGERTEGPLFEALRW